MLVPEMVLYCCGMIQLEAHVHAGGGDINLPAVGLNSAVGKERHLEGRIERGDGHDRGAVGRMAHRPNDRGAVTIIAGRRHDQRARGKRGGPCFRRRSKAFALAAPSRPATSRLRGILAARPNRCRPGYRRPLPVLDCSAPCRRISRFPRQCRSAARSRAGAFRRRCRCSGCRGRVHLAALRRRRKIAP